MSRWRWEETGEEILLPSFNKHSLSVPAHTVACTLMFESAFYSTVFHILLSLSISMCPECTENYCIGCFSKFHQKGALKLHRMVPIQRDLQTHVNSQDIAICLQKTINPSFCPGTAGLPNPSTPASASHYSLFCPRFTNAIMSYSYGLQALIMDQEETIGTDKQNSPPGLLRGEYNEEGSARSFQEAVREWRGERRDGGAELMTDALWIVMETQLLLIFVVNLFLSSSS
uniref:B box-type domain-containing protein n=1 Tax=Salarias fasciatus TaxID=181472 RepID=A0A672H2M3_SALFA